jgi:hypothetical protein
MLHLGALKADTNQPQLPAEPHHQIDFRQFFPPPEDISPAPPPELLPEPNTPRISSSLMPRTGFSGSDWLNLLFAVVTIIGGLLVSIRYFGGPEPFRRATSWPRELLYPRPPSAQAEAKIDRQAPLQNPSPDSKPTTIISQPRNSFRRNAKSAPKSPLRFASNGRASTSFPSAQSPSSNSTAGGSTESARGENGAGSRTAGSSRPGGAGRPPPPKTKPPPKSGGQTSMSEERAGGRNSGNPRANASAQQTANAQKSQRGEQSNHSDTATRIPRNNGGAGGSIRSFGPNRAGGSFGRGGGGGGFGGRN